jgi:MFS family permease
MVSLAMFFMSLGENLWKQFLPKYLEALGTPVVFIGLFGTTEDVLDGVYQYPGGWIGDRVGRRTALLLFVSLSSVGYATYWCAPTWPWLFAGLLFVSAWSSLASPTLFSIVGDVLPPHRRAMGFTVQSITKRVPIMVAPSAGGLLIARWGLGAGVRASLLVSIGLAAATAVACTRISIEKVHEAGRTRIAGVWRSLPGELRRLLLSDVFIRTCEGMVDVFLVLYATNVIGISVPQFGALVAVQMATALATYIPAGRLADQLGRKPFVAATFTFFALFPIAVVLSRGFVSLIGAFVIGGLREVGEPARKAMIVDMVQPALRARSIGLYYLVRSLTISPAAFVGGLLWRIAPVVPFVLAGGVGLVGALVFAVTVPERAAD